MLIYQLKDSVRIDSSNYKFFSLENVILL